jgi:putative lipoic acid-binding regulatory protein
MTMKKKAHFEYPCTWAYKVIGTDEETMRQAVREIIQDCACTIKLSNSSKTGKYCCLDVELVVCSEEQRLNIYEYLKKHSAIKIVL